MNEEKERPAESGPEPAGKRIKVTWELTRDGMLQERRIEEPVPEAPSAPTGEQEEPRPAAGESGIEHPSALAKPSTPAVPSPSAEPAAPAEPSAPAGERKPRLDRLCPAHGLVRLWRTRRY